MIELIVAIFVLIIHLFFIFTYHYSLSSIDIYYFVVAPILALAFVLKTATHFKAEVRKIYWGEVVIFLCVVAFGLYVIDIRSIWIDEYSQYQSANPPSSYYSLSNAAALEQQPPFGYVVTSFFTSVIGRNVFGLRLYSVLFMAMSCLYIKRILDMYRVSLWISGVAILYYLTRPTVFNFLAEGKPYAIALFFSLYCLHYYVELLDDSKKFSFLKMTYVLFFLVCSIGLQPGVLALALFFAYLLSCPSRFAFKVLLANVVAAILFVPVFLNIVYWSESMSQFKEALTLEYFMRSFVTTSGKYWQLLLGYGPHVIESLTLLALFIISLFKKQRKFHFILLSLIIFYLIFTLSFVSFINWALLLKYYVVSIPILIITLSLGANYFLQTFFVVRRPYLMAPFAIMIIAMAIPAGLHFDREADLMLDNRLMSWGAVYRFFNKTLGEHDKVYFLTFNEPGEWCMVKPVASEFYIKSNLDQFITERFIPNNNLTLPDYPQSEQGLGDIYLVSPINWSNDHMEDQDLLDRFANLEIKHVDGVRIFKIKENQQTKNERLIDFYQGITDLYSDFAWTFTARVSLIYLYSLEDRYDEQDRELEKLLAIEWPNRRSLAGMSIDRSKEVMNLRPFLSKRF